MMTWMRLWPIFLIPLLFTAPLGLLPRVDLLLFSIDGGVIRQWTVNQGLLPLLSDHYAQQVVDAFQRASFIEEYAFYCFVCVNLTGLLMPVLYGLGEIMIRLNTWFAINDLKLKNQQARKV